MKRQKLPRTHAALNALLHTSYNDGYRIGREHAENSAKAAGAKRLAETKQVHLEALREATKAASVFGQMIDALSRAMQSEKNQL